MKQNFLTVATAVLLLISLNRLNAQTTLTKLNQIELMKQFIGTWKCEIGKDTTRFWEVKPFGAGLECSLKDVAGNSVIREAKRLWGYDKQTDKYIGLEVSKETDMRIYAQWFKSEYKGVAVPFSYISAPEKAPYRGEAEFKSVDMYIITAIVNNKPVRTDTYTRVK